MNIDRIKKSTDKENDKRQRYSIGGRVRARPFIEEGRSTGTEIIQKSRKIKENKNGPALEYVSRGG